MKVISIIAVPAVNTPQEVVAVLNVLPASSDLAPIVKPTSMIFTAASGIISPGSQDISVFDPTGAGKGFTSGLVLAQGSGWS